MPYRVGRRQTLLKRVLLSAGLSFFILNEGLMEGLME